MNGKIINNSRVKLKLTFCQYECSTGGNHFGGHFDNMWHFCFTAFILWNEVSWKIELKE